MAKSFGKRLFKGLGIFAAALAGILIVLQIILSTSLTTRLVNKYAGDFVDGELSFEKVSANVFKNFPAISLKLDRALLTYPHEMFAAQEAQYPDIKLLMKGRGEQIDTLASFSTFELALNPWSLLGGKVDLRRLTLDSPRAYIKLYADGTSNLSILLPSSDESEDADTQEVSDTSEVNEESSLPDISLRKVFLTGNPDIVFCDVKDTLLANLRMKELSINGHISTANIQASHGKLQLDSLAVFGRAKSDTLLFGLPKLELRERNRKLRLDAEAKAFALTRAYGRLAVPVSVQMDASFPEDSVMSVEISSMHAELAGIPLDLNGIFRMHADSYFVDAEASISECNLNSIIENYGTKIIPQLKGLSTDAKLDMLLLAKGYYSADKGLMPELAAQLLLPESNFSHSEYGLSAKLAVELNADARENAPLNASLDKFVLAANGLEMDADASMYDLLGADPVFDIDADLIANLRELVELLPSDSGYSADGSLEACLFGKIKMSQLGMPEFSNADLSALLLSDGFALASQKDSLSAGAGPLEIQLSAMGNKSDDSVDEGARMLGLSFSLDTLHADYKKQMLLNASKLSLRAQNSADILSHTEGQAFYPFQGELRLGSVFMRDSDSSVVVLKNSHNRFRIRHKNENPDIPVLSLKSDNDAAFVRLAAQRAGFRGLSVNADAQMNTVEKRIKMNALRDSLATIYPDIPKDSLFRHHFTQKMGTYKTPEWMQDEEFRKQDIKISLSDNVKKYFREWDFNGKIDLQKAFLFTPYFPLRNSAENFSGSFNNDRVDLNSITLKSGSSDISANGSIYGLRRALLGRGTIGLDLNVNSNMLNANELLAAYSTGANMAEEEIEQITRLDDDSFDKACEEIQVVADSTSSSLIVLPGNVNAKINLEANSIIYSTLDIDWMESEIALRERCLQMSNTVATSNMGDIYFEAFYSTCSRQDIKTGFCLNLVDITAEKVIELVPQVDSILPMLKSFYGMLDCSVAATAELDEQMNILMPTVNGVTRIVGKDLEIRNDKDISRFAKMLMFRNKKTIHVDKMSVEGLLQDNKLEVFPFMLNVDRYKLALSGVQNMDSSFKYHVSVMKSPLIFKFGINLYGDFDNWKFKLGKARYRNEKNVPAFTKVIDQTKLSLTNSIHTIFDKGVDAALAENASQKAITDFKKNTSYVQAVDVIEEEDSLDTGTSKKLEQMQKMYDGVEALGLDLDELTPESYDALDEDTRGKLTALGVTREYLLKRENEDED